MEHYRAIYFNKIVENLSKNVIKNGYSPSSLNDISCEIYDWCKVGINRDFLSHTEEINEKQLCIREDYVDSFLSFIRIKSRLLLTEKLKEKDIKNYSESEMINEKWFYFKTITLDLSRVVMSNSEEYYVVRN